MKIIVEKIEIFVGIVIIETEKNNNNEKKRKVDASVNKIEKLNNDKFNKKKHYSGETIT